MSVGTPPTPEAYVQLPLTVVCQFRISTFEKFSQLAVSPSQMVCVCE